MGGAASRFHETDWDSVDGGVKETFDGAPPTTAHTILTLTKHESLVNQRAYKIEDDQNTQLYTTEAVQGTSKWFDVLSNQGEKLFRVQSETTSRMSWDILAYGKPCFEGQEPDKEATEKAGGGFPLYRKGKIVITWDKHHGHVYLCGPSTDTKEGVVKEEDPLLKVEEIRSITAQYQSFVPKGPIDLPHPPLVGHWVWEHTQNAHKMKMHLAKNTDICLHCIVAVVANMVQVERKVEGTE